MACKGLFIGAFVALCVRVNQNGAQDVVNSNVQYRIMRQRDGRALSITQQSHVDQIVLVCDVQFVYLNAQPILGSIRFVSQDYRMLFRTLI